MSDVSDSIRASILVADFANVDSVGKLNVVGGGVAITALDSQSGATAPMSVVVTTAADPRFIGQEYTLELCLYGADGQLVAAPGPVGTAPVRVARVVAIERPHAAPGTYLPADATWPAANMIVSFQGGLPLAVGKSYEWRAMVDGAVVSAASLHVAGPPPITIG